MAYGIFYAQCEITRKSGRLPSVEEAIEMAEQCFDECNQNPCGAYHTLADAQEALAKLDILHRAKRGDSLRDQRSSADAKRLEERRGTLDGADYAIR